MAELVAHEVQVATIDAGSSYQADHLVEGNAAVHHAVAVILAEVPVHVCINKAEDDSLVTHQSLVMAFCIGDGLLILTAVGYLPENTGGLPILILLFLNGTPGRWCSPANCWG